MRPNVLEAWKQAVAAEMAAELPQFLPYPKRERGEDRGMLRYVWPAREGLWCFVVLRPIDSEAFDAHVGWSTDGRCPYALPQQADALDSFEGLRAMSCSMRLVPRQGLAHWNFWEVPDSMSDDPQAFAAAYALHFGKTPTMDEARAEVDPAVKKGVREIVEYGGPNLLRRIAFRADC